MMTIANSIYTNLKKRGLHNWAFLSGQEDIDFDFDDLDLDEEQALMQYEE